MTMASVVVVVLASCSPVSVSTESSDTSRPLPSTTTTVPPTTTTTELPAFAVSSPAFAHGEEIPSEYTCDGEDVSPALNLVGLPLSTRAIAVIVEDPDAPLGTWYHWVELDIPASSGSFDIARDAGRIGIQGINSWNVPGYMGPCPPEGEEHRYLFRIFALDSMLGLPDGVAADTVLSALTEHALETVELTGVYGR